MAEEDGIILPSRLADSKLLSQESRDYLASLIVDFKANDATVEKFIEFWHLNISVEMVTPNDHMIGFIRRWMESPDDFYGAIERDAIRREVREAFPLQPNHYLKLRLELENLIGVIEKHGSHGQPTSGIAGVVQKAYAQTALILRDQTMPLAPSDQSMTPGQAFAGIQRLIHFLQSKASAVQIAEMPERADDLTDTERNIVDAVGNDTLRGQAIADKLKYPFNSNFKATLSSLKKRGIFGNEGDGYFVKTGS
jgi:hypothetical protein